MLVYTLLQVALCLPTTNINTKRKNSVGQPLSYATEVDTTKNVTLSDTYIYLPSPTLPPPHSPSLFLNLFSVIYHQRNLLFWWIFTIELNSIFTRNQVQRWPFFNNCSSFMKINNISVYQKDYLIKHINHLHVYVFLSTNGILPLVKTIVVFR